MSTATTRPAPSPGQDAAPLYDSDPHAWSLAQASALRRRDFAAVDWDNVIEEISDVGERHRDTWTSLCANVIRHLLKIEHHHQARTSTLEKWEQEIQNFRDQMVTTIVRNPSLQSKYAVMFADAWREARRRASRELGDYDVENKLQSDKALARRRRSMMLSHDCPYRFEDVTAFELRRDDKHPQHDDAVLPPQVEKVLEERRNRDRELEWDR